MTSWRKPIFDAARGLGATFDNDADVAVLDKAIEEALRKALFALPDTPKPSDGLGRRVSADFIPVLHAFEGCRLTAYPDPGSSDGHPWTIGYGATGPGIGPGVTWTQKQADARFLVDLARFEDGVSRLLGPAPTSQHQFDALVSLAYNIGLDEDADIIAEGLGDSTLLKRHLAGDFAGAAECFISWRKNDGKDMPGLVKRRNREAQRYRGEG